MQPTSPILLLFLLAIPIACISWTVTHEEIFKEWRYYFGKKSRRAKSLFVRKFSYMLTCEYCFSHYITIVMLALTEYKLVYDDWRGYIIAGFSLVWIANIYMSLYSFVRLSIKKEKIELDEIEKESEKRVASQKPNDNP